MKFGVVVFPGSNCDQDIIHVLEKVSGTPVARLWHKEHDLQGADFIVLPGGFSYGDYLRSGAIARFSPIMQEVIKHADNGGYVMGICNGFQILTEAGLLPGALLHNQHRKFICQNVHLKTETQNSLITSAIAPGTVLNIPVAHGEGNFFIGEKGLNDLKDNDQILFRYCDADGYVNGETNLNGSLQNIAGVCNINRNVFGMMPHPERAASELLGNTDGLQIFSSILQKATT